MSASVVRQALILTALSFLLGFGYNGVTGKGIFRSAETTGQSQGTLPTSDLISIDAAKELFDAGEALFVDTRHAFDFRLAHIPGALNIPLTDAEESVRKLDAQKDRTIVVYCDGAECNSSLEVGALFIMNGYTDVRIFFSGWSSWEEQGYPIEEHPE